MVVRGAGDEVLADVVRGIDARKPAEGLLVHLPGALEKRQLRHPERIAGGHNQDGLHARLVGIAIDHAPAGVALVIARRIRERTLRLDVRLLRAYAADELEAALHELQIAAK